MLTVNQVQDVLQKYIDIANRIVPSKTFGMPEINIKEMGKVAGNANGFTTENGIINLCRTLLADNEEEFIKDTIPHEFAHIVVHKVYGRRAKPHGKEWKNVMRHFGCEPKTYHNMDVDKALLMNGQKTRAQTRPFVYICPTCDKEYNMTPQMHKKIRLGSLRWCKGSSKGFIKEKALKFSHNALNGKPAVTPKPTPKVIEVEEITNPKPIEVVEPQPTKIKVTMPSIVKGEMPALNGLVEYLEIHGAELKVPAKKKPYVTCKANVGRVQVSYNSRSELFSVLVYMSKDMTAEPVCALLGRNMDDVKHNTKHHYINVSNVSMKDLMNLFPKVGTN